MKKALNLTAFVIFLTSLSYSAEPLVIKAKALVNTEGNTLRVAVVLINQSDEIITVLTNPDSKILGRGINRTLTLQTNFGGKTEMLGFQLTPSISKYDPVSLEPNEASGFFFTIESDTIKMESGEEISIQYTIGNDLSEKYGLLSSTIVTKTELLALAPPTNEK